MRELTSTLLAAARQPGAVPCVKLEAVNKAGGVVRLDWERLYTGTEPDCYHALAVPSDGSLVRVRITPPADARKVYRQRVTAPSPESDFSQWTYAGHYNALVVAAAALGTEVSIFWINLDRELRRIKSGNCGAAWSGPETLDYSPTSSVYGIAAVYKPSGDLAVFFADMNTLYVKKYVGGQWQSKAAWNKDTGILSGVAAIYDGDWNLLVSGKDTAGNFKLWGLVYGDGGDVPAGTWSDLKELASAPAEGYFQFAQPFLDKTDACRSFFVEKFTGTEAYSRPFRSHAVPVTGFSDGLWREPAPFNLSSDYGLAMAHDDSFAWLSCPAGVWRAPLALQPLDISADVVSVRHEAGETSGSLIIELRNDDGRYAAPGEGPLAVLDVGCALEFAPGYVTTAGNELSTGLSFHLESYEHVSAGGKACLVLRAVDGWAALSGWKARHQIRWNRTPGEASVKDIIGFIMARAGIRLEVVSQSAPIEDFYPDFTVSAGETGRDAVLKLLSFVPDVVFIEGNTAYLLNPSASDSPVYAYGGEHPIFEGTYRRGAMKTNRVQVEGYASGFIVADSFAWEEVERLSDRLTQLADPNIITAEAARQRGEAYLRQAEIEAEAGSILVPVNCGQQLYDVIEVTDPRAGLDAVGRRVLGISLLYSPSRGEYRQRLLLGAV